MITNTDENQLLLIVAITFLFSNENQLLLMVANTVLFLKDSPVPSISLSFVALSFS